MKHFTSFYGPGRCLFCPEPAVAVVGDHTAEGPVCATHQRQLDERSGGRIRVVGLPAPALDASETE